MITGQSELTRMMQVLKVLHEGEVFTEDNLVIRFHRKFTAEIKPRGRIRRKVHPRNRRANPVLVAPVERSLQNQSPTDMAGNRAYIAGRLADLQKRGQAALVLHSSGAAQ